MFRFKSFPYLILTFLCISLFSLSIYCLPVVDRDEARFAQATKQMIESNDYLAIKFQDSGRNKKPAGIYWLQSVAVKLCRQELNTIWPYRLPSLFGMLFTVLLTFFIAQRLFNERIAWMAALVLLSSPIVMVEATIATTDAALFTVITLCLGIVALIYQEGQPSFGRSILLGLCLAAGVYLKGPLIVFFFTATLVGLILLGKGKSFLKNIYWTPVLGLPVLLVLPWIITIQSLTQGQFIHDSLGQDFLQKLLSAQEGHGAPPGFFLVVLIIGLPSIVFWLPQTFKAAWKERFNHPSVTYCLAAIIPAWLILELVPTKLLHYPMPLYPWLAMLGAWGLQGAWRPWQKRVLIFSLIGCPLILAKVLPRIEEIWLSEKIYEAYRSYEKSHKAVILYGYEEPSAVFRIGTHTVLAENLTTVASFLNQFHGQIFSSMGTQELKELAPQRKIQFLKQIKGFNYSKGKKIILYHYLIAE